MKVITAIDEDYSIDTNNGVKIFLAGGITNCPDWQNEAIEFFKSEFYELSNISIKILMKYLNIYTFLKTK